MPETERPNVGRFAPGMTPSNFWASDPNCLDHVGCLYIGQGFEFDSVGFIWGRDPHWDPATNDWIGDPSHSHDAIVKRSGDRCTDLVKRTYRVLLTRGLKGCYLVCEDEPTHALLRDCLASDDLSQGRGSRGFNALATTILGSHPNGMNQVGGVYTAQGFEFDYVGVIWGRDLRWDPVPNDWIGDPSHSHDSIVKRSGDRFTDLVKRTYRVLLTRGLKGCYVYFEGEGTRHRVDTLIGDGMVQDHD